MNTLFQRFSVVVAVILSISPAFAKDPKVSLAALKSTLEKLGPATLEGSSKVADRDVPNLKFGPRVVNNNYTVVDNIKKQHDGTATLFVKAGDEYVRVSTNVLKDDGTRAVGTTLAKNKAYEAIQKGETFCGQVDILGKPYDTCYEPIKSSTGEVIGIYYVGYQK